MILHTAIQPTTSKHYMLYCTNRRFTGYPLALNCLHQRQRQNWNLIQTGAGEIINGYCTTSQDKQTRLKFKIMMGGGTYCAWCHVIGEGDLKMAKD